MKSEQHEERHQYTENKQHIDDSFFQEQSDETSKAYEGDMSVKIKQ